MLQCLQYWWIVDEYTLRKHVLIQKMLILKKKKGKIEKITVLPVQNHDVQLEMKHYEADQDVGKTSVTWRGLLLHASEWRQ